MRKYIALVLALVCVLGLVGCSENQQEDMTEKVDTILTDNVPFQDK